MSLRSSETKGRLKFCLVGSQATGVQKGREAHDKRRDKRDHGLEIYTFLMA